MKEISEGVYYLGLHDYDRKIFDQLVPLPQGTTYNSYFIRGAQKCALIDTMYAKFAARYADMLAAENIVPDYIICNRAEPDHTGVLPQLLSMFPKTEVLCSPKCSENLQNMLHISPDRIREVKDGEELDLGGKTLKFIMAPWVHWPDTMFTHLIEDNYLFTCDFLGAHYTRNELWADETSELAESAKRYYAEIMMPFRNFCVKYLSRVRQISPKVVLPSHGPIYKNPDFILNLYGTWTSPNTARKVLIAYVSMYDNSRMMVDYLASKLRESGVDVVAADLMQADEGELAMELVDAAGIVFGTSMVLTGPHPKSVYAAYLANILRPKGKFYAVVGSFGWGGNLCAPIDNMFTLFKPKKLTSVIAKGRPAAADFAALDSLCAEILAEL